MKRYRADWNDANDACDVKFVSSEETVGLSNNATYTSDESLDSLQNFLVFSSPSSSPSLACVSGDSNSDMSTLVGEQHDGHHNNAENCINDNDLDDLPPVSSESDNDDDEDVVHNTTFEFVRKLGEWAVNLPREKTNQLLKILSQSGRFPHGDLPKDARSLICTPRHVDVVEKCGGQMIYFGVQQGLLQFASEITDTFSDSGCLYININIDGLPIQNSSNLQFWPILCAVHGTDIGPFTVALYCGKQKPTNLNDYLVQLVDEIILLQERGLQINCKCYAIKIHAFICDAPARAFIKCITGHTGKNGCERCDCIGTSVERRMVFCSVGSDRTDAAFRGNAYLLHKQTDSPLLKIANLDMIKMFVLDSMHLVFLGVIRRFLSFLKSGARIIKLGHVQLDIISLRLIEMSQYTPSDFARKPRGLNELERFKATELRQFMLYTGIVVLRGVVNDNLYELFLSLFIAIRICFISDKNERNKLLSYARKLLKAFVHNAKILCGAIFVTYNVHNLLHIVDDVEYFQCSLNDLSSFVFENYLQSLKRTVRGAKSNPLVSAAKRCHEYCHFNTKKIKKCHTKISTNNRDKYFISNDEQYCEIVEICNNDVDHEMVCLVFPHHKLHSFFFKTNGQQIFWHIDL
jgi:hypothetical protein